MRATGLFVALVCAALVGCDGGEVADPDAGPQVDAGPTCPAGQTVCGDTCRDTNVDRASCGTCGNACDPGEVCSAGTCALTCMTGLTDCSGSCRDTDTDRAHCGGCDMPCDAGEVCSEGSCVLSCADGLTDCTGSCRDTDTDRANCGGCNMPCDAGEVCSAGSCALSCTADLTDCSGSCRDTDTDRAHCGGCDMPCDAGEICSAGSCVLSCAADLSECSGSCRDTQTDVAHCGGCDTPCDAGELCVAGECTTSCPIGQTVCGSRCVDTTLDVGHCGGCDSTCNVDEVCAASTCVPPVDIQLLSISDWHGQLDPISGVGGAAVLSAYFARERATNPSTVVVTAGDAFGGSPPLSGFFDEEPAVRALGLMGVAVDTFGNHNFDRGITNLQTLIDLATYEFVSANLGGLTANLSGVQSPYHLVRIGELDVAFIGITNPDAPTLVAPNAMGTLTVEEPIAAALAARDAARVAGADVFVALVHMGATGFDSASSTYSGPLIDFAEGLEGFHVVFGDHTNLQVNTVINGATVVENLSQGRTYARVVLRVHPTTGELFSRSSTFVVPTATGVTPDPVIEAMLAPYRTMLAAEMDGVIGIATDVFPRGSNVERLGEVAIGNLVADSMRVRYGTQIAFTNGGGLRQPLPSSHLPADTTLRRTTAGYAAGPPYDLVRGDAYAVLPFGNVVVTRTVTGAQLHQLLEHGFSAMPAANGRFPQVSGIRVRYSLSAAVGSRVTSVTLTDGTPILADSTVYTLATNDFVNVGGDGYTMLADGTGTTRDVMADVLADHITTLGTITPTLEGRITQDP